MEILKLSIHVCSIYHITVNAVAPKPNQTIFIVVDLQSGLIASERLGQRKM